MKKRNLFKQLSLVLFLSLFLQSCEEKELIGEELSIYKTVSIENAKRIMNGNISKSESIEIIPDWSTVSQDVLSFTDDALLTNVEATVTSIPSNEYSPKLLFLEIEGSLFNVIETNKIAETFSDGKIKEGKVFYHSTSGNYLKGFKISNGLITHELAGSVSVSKTNDDCNEDLDRSSTFCDETLDEIVISAPVDETPRFVAINYYDFTDGTDAGGSTGGGSDTWDSSVVLFDDIVAPEITDIEDYLKCFDIAQSATMSLYVDQPKSNHSDTWSGVFWSPNVGHTFIGITQGGVTRIIGYYPSDSVSPADPSEASSLHDNSGDSFDVSITVNLTPQQLSSVLNAIKNYNPNYNLNTFNCTDFGLTLFNDLGFNIPDTTGSWPGGGGSNPGNLGQDLRNWQLPSGATRNSTGGNAPSNSGTCN